MPTPEHNPQSILPSEIPPGWRLCRESEREKLPHDAKFWGCVHGQPHWLKDSCCQGEALQDWEWKEYTYITATPLPESEQAELADIFQRQLAEDNPFVSEPSPLPPTPVKTQLEKDEAAFDKWWFGCRDFIARSGFYAALDAERAHFAGRSAEEVAEKIKEISLYGNIISGAQDALRALLSPPKKGGKP